MTATEMGPEVGERTNHADPVLSVVVPLLNEEGSIDELFRRVADVIENRIGVSFEIVFVDDGSTDRSWALIHALHTRDRRARGLRFSRNFGHQYAVKAGLDYAAGQAVISMDCDLQHPPVLIEALYEQWREGYQIVTTVKERTEGLGLIRSVVTRIGYWVINTLTEVPVEPGAADFRLLDRKVVEQVKRLNEDPLLLRGVVGWVGYRSTVIPYVAERRFAGESKYSFRRLLGLVTSGLMSFSPAPLRFLTYLGLSLVVASFGFAVVVVARAVQEGAWNSGWISVLVLLFAGINFLALGVLAEYVARIHRSLKNRPSYIVAESTDK